MDTSTRTLQIHTHRVKRTATNSIYPETAMTTFPGLSITNSLLQLRIRVIHDTAKNFVFLLRIRAIPEPEDSFVATKGDQ